jgi:opacity protein-like surface antigen
MMTRNLARAIFILFLAAPRLMGQQLAINSGPEPSRIDLAGGYNLVNANAPPGSCGCFTMNGAFVSADANLNDRLSLLAESNGGQASNISALGQNLTLGTLMAGPRVSWPHFRYAPYGEFVAGVAHGTGSYFPSATSTSGSAWSFAFAAGGGLDFNLTDRLGIRLFDARYLRTSFPNATNASQNQIQIESGVVIHFGNPGFGSRREAEAHIADVPADIP